MAVIGGIVTEQGIPVEGRTVRVHSMVDGSMIDEDQSNSSGVYSLDTGAVPASDVFVIALPIQEELAEPSYNASVVVVF